MRRGISFSGEPILITFQPGLRAWRGKLLTHHPHQRVRGQEVHAGSFLHKRLIVLDAGLLRTPAERDRVLAHEIFHFVWWKMAPGGRRSYEDLIRAEAAARLGGEMGWSAEWRKQLLLSRDWRGNTRRLREYLCESFCDTAAAELLGLRAHDEITLPARARRLRKKWMEEQVSRRSLRI